MVGWVAHQMIEEMYDARYAHDLVEAAHEDPANTSNMPVFVYQCLSKKYGLKSLVEQACWDLVCNIEEYRQSYQEVPVSTRALYAGLTHTGVLGGNFWLFFGGEL